MSENSGSINDNFQRLFNDAKEYVKLQTDYLRIQSVEKLTILISTLLFAITLLILAMGALFYLFFSLAYALDSILHSLALSFGAITLFYLVMIALLVIFRQKLLVNPLLNFLMKLFYDKSKEYETEEKNKSNDKI